MDVISKWQKIDVLKHKYLHIEQNRLFSERLADFGCIVSKW